jgi:hypothetical protein
MTVAQTAQEAVDAMAQATRARYMMVVAERDGSTCTVYTRSRSAALLAADEETKWESTAWVMVVDRETGDTLFSQGGDFA